MASSDTPSSPDSGGKASSDSSRSRDTNLRNEADRFLIESIRKGDPEAFTQLVDRYGGRLRAYAARRVSGSGIDPEDAVQETLLGLLQSLERIDQVRSLQAYLFQILRNKIVDMARKRPEAHGMHQVPLAGSLPEDSSRHGFEPVSPVDSPSHYARRDEAITIRNRILCDVLDEFLEELRSERNFRDLMVLELLFFGSWKNREIAREVEVSEPTITRIKTASLEKLGRMVRRHEMMNPGLNLLDTEDNQSQLVRSIWTSNLMSCPKRNTLGSHSLGALDDDWTRYVRFHLEVVQCEYCLANLADLEGDGEPLPPRARERIFASSVGFLRKLGESPEPH